MSSVESAEAVNASQADAVGLNFYPASARYLPEDQREAVTSRFRPELVRVGVFVNASVSQIGGCVDSCGLDLIQLHGDEPPEMIRDLPRGRVIRAIRLDKAADAEAGKQEILGWVRQLDRIGLPVAGILVDAFEPGAYGGTGMRLDWHSLEPWRDWLGDTPLILAGGLTPSNVAQAIVTARPSAVDTASGVEVAKGTKDPQLTREFAAAAVAEFDRSDSTA